jgi:hypothetical protein
MGRLLRSGRRRWAAIGVVAVLGLLAGAGYAALSPPVLTSSALVALPPSTQDTATQVVIAGSDPVLVCWARSGHDLPGWASCSQANCSRSCSGRNAPDLGGAIHQRPLKSMLTKTVVTPLCPSPVSMWHECGTLAAPCILLLRLVRQFVARWGSGPLDR